MSTFGRMEQVVLKAEHLRLEGGMALNMQIAGPSSRILTHPPNQSLHFQAQEHLSFLSANHARALISGFKLGCLVLLWKYYYELEFHTK